MAVRVTAADAGSVTWQGQTFTGKGDLTEQQRISLRELVDGKLGPALVFASLELACRPEASEVKAAAGAALLMPWQLVLKYLSPYPAATARHYASLTACRYFPDVTAPSDTLDAALPPAPNIMMLGNESPIPSVLLFFPLDGEGAMRPPGASSR